MISICIANYNGMGIIEDCLRSVLEQHGDLSIEILVHDDASNDGSALYIRENYPNVVMIESTVNAGFCIANNRMVAMARGKFVLLLNNDAALFPHALETLLAEAHSVEQPAILTLPQYDALSGELVDRGCLLDPFFNPIPNLDIGRADVAMVIGACLWIPRILWDQLEGLPEWFESIGEDMYLCCRARLAGYPVRAVNNSGYYHWQGKSFGGNKIVDCSLVTTYKRRALSERNKTLVMVITCPSPVIQLLLPIHMFLLLIEGTLLSIFKARTDILKRIYFPAIVGVFVNYKKWRKIRRRVIETRSISVCSIYSTFNIIPQKLRLLWRHGLPRVT